MRKKLLKRILTPAISKELPGIEPDKLPEISFQAMQGDGSSRQFYRFFVGERSLIAILAPVDSLTGINENDSYHYIGKQLMKAGIPVPRIYAYDRSEGVIIVEDLGDTHLQSLLDFNARYSESKNWYHSIIPVLARMHLNAVKGFDTRYCFDTPVYDKNFIYQRELLYFKRELVERYCDLDVSDHEMDKEFKKLTDLVSLIPNNFFMHRDFQSRNIMVKGSDFFFIDFQGGRLGPPTYDLASLLIDPYVAIPDELQEELMISYFLEMKSHLGMSRDEFVENYWLTAICRNLQILAAFVFLSQVRKKSFFANYIPHATCQLKRVLENSGNYEFRVLKEIAVALTQKFPTDANGV